METAEASAPFMTHHTIQAIDGVLGPRPTRFLAPDAELETADGTIIGAEHVAAAIRELSTGASDIRLRVDDGHGFAVWSVFGSTRTRVVFEFEVRGGVVTRMRAARLDAVG